MPGTRYCQHLEDYGLSWPLPEKLPGTEGMGGAYFKVSESDLPPEAAQHPNVGVGAAYEWRPDESPSQA